MADVDAGLVEKLESYWDDALIVLKSPYTFFSDPRFAGPLIFRRGLTLLLLSGALVFLLLAPARWYHEQEHQIGYYESVSIVGTIAYGIVLHVTLRVLGARQRSAKETVGAVAVYFAIVSLFTVILMYPSILLIGPSAVLPWTKSQGEPKIPPELNLFYFKNLLATSVIAMVWFVFGFIPMMARFQAFRSLGKTRVVAALLFILVVLPIVLVSIFVD